MPLLQVSDLTARYSPSDDQPAVVDHLSFCLSEGEIVGLTGPSGCGKTTTALAVLGLLPPQSRVTGSIRFDGEELTRISERRWREVRGAAVSLVLQEPSVALMPVMRAGTQIAEIARAHLRCDAAAARERAIATMHEVGLGEDVERIYDAYPHQLSGGQQQRILLAQALVCRPRLVIADEPTASLDPDVAADILRLIANLNGRYGTAFLVISHSADVLACAPRVLHMENGKLEPAHHTEAHFEPTAASDRFDAARNGPDAARTFMVRADEPIVEARQITRIYRHSRWFSRRHHDVHALSSVTLRLPRGATIGLAGPSGSGKSTLARCLAGLERVDAGEVRVGGCDITRLSPSVLRAYRNVVQLVFQDSASALNPRFTAGDAIAEPLVIQGISTRENRRRRVEALLAQVGLSPARARARVTQFSGGERQRIAIARAMALSPRALIFDEAFSGIDAAQRSCILDLLFSLQRTYGLTYLFISHDLERLAAVTPQIVVLEKGRIVDGIVSSAYVPRRVSAEPALLHTSGVPMMPAPLDLARGALSPGRRAEAALRTAG
jgi:peptide/nickel transport system ATP-binding protein